jgi:hypothetical protein
VSRIADKVHGAIIIVVMQRLRLDVRPKSLNDFS